MRSRPFSPLSLLSRLALIASLAACGGESPRVATTQVELALDFTADALLELYVLDGATVACGDLRAGATEPEGEGVTVHAVDRTPASGLNGGGSLTFQLGDLPAEVPLVFFARAVETGVVLARDCEDDVVVPADGEIEVALVVSEP